MLKVQVYRFGNSEPNKTHTLLNPEQFCKIASDQNLFISQLEVSGWPEEVQLVADLGFRDYFAILRVNLRPTECLVDFRESGSGGGGGKKKKIFQFAWSSDNGYPSPSVSIHLFGRFWPEAPRIVVNPIRLQKYRGDRDQKFNWPSNWRAALETMHYDRYSIAALDYHHHHRRHVVVLLFKSICGRWW